MENTQAQRPINSFQERQQRKAERFAELSREAKTQAEAADKGAQRIADIIPMGQPILVGHHSEGRHRRDLERMGRGFEKARELSEKSDYYANKAKNALDDSIIRSDDPEAAQKIAARIADLEREREAIKARPHQSYELSNLAGNIKRLKDRLKTIEETAKLPQGDRIINGVTLRINKELNRVQLIFPSIPSPEVRDKLKHSGFHWSPYNGAWQRMISNGALYYAESILEGLNETTKKENEGQ